MFRKPPFWIICFAPALALALVKKDDYKYIIILILFFVSLSITIHYLYPVLKRFILG